MKGTPKALLVSLVVVAAIVVSTGASGANGPGRAMTSGLATTVLTGDVIPGLSNYTDLGPVAANRQMNVVVTLHHDDAAVAAYEASVNDPSSAEYENWLSPDEFQQRFDAPASALAAVQGFATRNGLQLYNTTGLGDQTLAYGTAAQIQQTFNVSLHRYLDTNTGREFYANVNAPTVPANVGVSGVLGLQNLVQMKHGPTGPGSPQPQGQCVAGTCTGMLGPTELWSVYDQPSTDMGQGESIGIIGEGRTDDVIKALRRFESTRKLPFVPVQTYWTDPGAKTDDSGRVEWELDTQASTGMAPMVSQVRLYFGSDLSVGTLATTLQTWASDPNGPNQVNASLGLCEDNPALDGLLGPAQEASGFALAQAAVEGRAFFASTGDTGSGCAIGATAVNGVTYGPVPSASYPAADPNATGVGGTILYTDGGTPAKRVDERAWDHTGGVRSNFLAMPSFQKNIALLANTFCASQPNGNPYPAPTPCRGTSDVAALSGDATIIVNHRVGSFQANGYDMVDLNDSSGSDVYSDHFSEGGTSLASPLWAGMWARVNAAHTTARHKAGPAGRPGDKLYPLLGTNAFYDVIEGANPLPATPGWDFPTGLGTPDITNIMKVVDGGNLKPVHNTKPGTTDPAPIQAAGVSYGCPATFNDPNGDAFSLPQSAPQLDILHGDVALSSDGSAIRAALTVANLSTNVPTGFTSMDWIMYWTQPDTGIAPPTNYTKTYWAVEATVDILGGITYTDGWIAFDDSGNYQYNSVNTVTGKFVTGPNGVVEVDAPLADVGHLAPGTQLGTVGGATDEGSPLVGLITDTAQGGGSWTLGTTSCIG